MKLTINSQMYEVADTPNRPLLWVLRDELGLTGTHFSCGMGQCGTCTVLLNGKPVKSCLTPLSILPGKLIQTIDNLADQPTDAILPTVHRAFQLLLPECDWCLPAQVLTASALLSKNTRPTAAEIEREMSDVMCRCGQYALICQAVENAAQQLNQESQV